MNHIRRYDRTIRARHRNRTALGCYHGLGHQCYGRVVNEIVILKVDLFDEAEVAVSGLDRDIARDRIHGVGHRNSLVRGEGCTSSRSHRHQRNGTVIRLDVDFRACLNRLHADIAQSRLYRNIARS